MDDVYAPNPLYRMAMRKVVRLVSIVTEQTARPGLRRSSTHYRVELELECGHHAYLRATRQPSGCPYSVVPCVACGPRQITGQ